MQAKADGRADWSGASKLGLTFAACAVISVNIATAVAISGSTSLFPWICAIAVSATATAYNVFVLVYKRRSDRNPAELNRVQNELNS